MIKITEDEEQILRGLYDEANRHPSPEKENDIRVYYRKLAKRYFFNPLRVRINTKGEIWPITKESVYVVWENKNGGSILMVTRDKIKAFTKELEQDGNHTTEVPLE